MDVNEGRDPVSVPGNGNPSFGIGSGLTLLADFARQRPGGQRTHSFGPILQRERAAVVLRDLAGENEPDTRTGGLRGEERHE